ncbi:transcriptional regulator [Stenotrophomonas maltophilia]|jgi:transcriptional regulator with XRE-family HTH domain|uniref:Transcriptional regulator n=2 Tax=Stenotrophomonas pavanii TaxID=487698 RepID=A0ABN6GQF4_9GAMM|nr:MULTISPECIES: transcriptional regulator [Stenotrophomonas]MCW8343193.1 transcriptional regulator [Stenotrophomonas sp. SG1]MDA5339989.1 transcriptional regulator [Stenotrophomonas maltophilia]MDQ7270722.1 transcriptional regulator [Stenotrophomonas sp. Sm3212]MDQ7277919.1 transcriptional regulator [Stenotrophomonas sp. Sm3147]MDQ7285517.1 transcriptional regulator [Stenotrophomonas sp. Sm5341]
MNTLGQRLAIAMKKAGHPRPADLARAAASTTATISNWLNDHVSPAHVKAEQLFRIADAAKLDARELLYGVGGLGVGERGNTYIPSQAHLDVWQDAYELVSHLVEEKGLEIDHRRHAALDLLAFELLMDGFSRSKVIRVLTTSMT